MMAQALFSNQTHIVQAAREYASRELKQYGEVERVFLTAQVCCEGRPHLWYVDLYFKGYDGVITTQIPLQQS